MPQNANEIKGKIISFLSVNGPSLPVHIAQSIGQSILFTSAFLSELLSDKRVKISNMRIGSSAIHFIPGQEPELEKFSNYLKNKEKEAYLLLKDKRFLKDSEVEPAIRVALRSIKDFAVPFEKNNEVYWKYFTVDESDFKKGKQTSVKKEPVEKPKEKELDILDEDKKVKEKVSPAKKQKPKNSKSNNKFFNKVKDFLESREIEILGIEEIAINKIIFRVNEKDLGECLIVAYNKKRVNEEDIIKAYKKSEATNLPYKIFSMGGTLKKTENLINASKTLKGIEKIG